MEKKFHLFTGDRYYPNGGIGDYSGAYATVEDALSWVLYTNPDWYHIASMDDRGWLVIVQEGWAPHITE